MSVTALCAQHFYAPNEQIKDGCVFIEDASIQAVGARAAVEVPTGALTAK